VSTTDAIRRPWTDYEAALNDAAPTDRQRQVFRLIYESARDRLVYRQGQGGARCLTLLRKPNGEPFAGFCDRED
jgi:hypothetical protein